MKPHTHKKTNSNKLKNIITLSSGETVTGNKKLINLAVASVSVG